MNRNILIIIISFFLLATVLVCVFRPKTHKPIAFEDRNFKLELISDEVAVPKTPDLNIVQKSVEINSKPVDINLPSMNAKTPALKSDINTSAPKTSSKNISKPQQNQQKTQIVSKNNSAKNQQNKTEQKKIEQKPVQKSQPKVVDNTQKPKVVSPVEKINEKPVTKPSVKVLTEEEEIIAWNKWRSDLQNKLMRDSKIAAPIGTSFEFSFTVDKFGTITNLKTWSSNPSYTPLAVRVIKPLLLSYQKTAILNFPTGSKRVITNVNGGFTMARSSRYSSPSDYNDYERVTK